MDTVDTAVGDRRTGWLRPAALCGALVALVALGCVLGVLAEELLASSLDRPVLRFIVDNRIGWLTTVMSALTTLGAGVLLLVIALGVGGAWWSRRGTFAPLVVLLVTWLGAEVLFNVVKLLVDRARPTTALAVNPFDGLAFPSGHATTAVAVWGMVAALLILAATTRRARLAACAAAATIAIVVGITRVYLGAHWTSDVLGGWLLGSLWLLAVLWLVRPKELVSGKVRSADTAV